MACTEHYSNAVALTILGGWVDSTLPIYVAYIQIVGNLGIIVSICNHLNVWELCTLLTKRVIQFWEQCPCNISSSVTFKIWKKGKKTGGKGRKCCGVSSSNIQYCSRNWITLLSIEEPSMAAPRQQQWTVALAPPPGKNILLGRTELGSLAERKLTVWQKRIGEI